MSTKTSALWAVERTDWFGECEDVADRKGNITFDTRAEAEAWARELRRTSKAVDDPSDKIRYRVYSMVWERDV